MSPFNSRFHSSRSFANFDQEFEQMQRRGQYFQGFVFLMICLGCLVFFGTVLFRLTGTLPARTRGRAEVLAAAYATNVHGWTNPYVQCAGMDTDNNGYVTCMVSNRAGASEQIECADQGISDQMNNICRPYRTINIVNGGQNLQ